jgi:hypothetical protein
VLRVAGLGTNALQASETAPRVRHLGSGIARRGATTIWRALNRGDHRRTVGDGGRRRAIEEVIRMTAPMHDGFKPAALHRHRRLIGIATAAEIRGLGVDSHAHRV